MLSRPEDLTLLLLLRRKITRQSYLASPWDHRVYEKEGEKIEKYQGLKREIGRLWGIRHLEVRSPGSHWRTRSSKHQVGYMA